MKNVPGTAEDPRDGIPLESAEHLRSVLRHGVFFLRRMDSAGELTSQQIGLMAMLKDGGLRMSAIAANLGVRTPTATQSVDRLVKAGLVQRQADPVDARAVLVSLTDRGAAAMAEEDRHRNHRVATVLARLDPRELALLEAALPVLEKLASPTGGMTGEHRPRPAVHRS